MKAMTNVKSDDDSVFSYVELQSHASMIIGKNSNICYQNINLIEWYPQ